MIIHNERVKETKIRVDALKAEVTALMARVAEARDLARGTVPRRQSLWSAYEQSKRALASSQEKLREANSELVRLAGTTGSDPRWTLLREAWHVLSRLDEDGVDIGERGHALIDEIEFHVPHAKLHEDITAADNAIDSQEKAR